MAPKVKTAKNSKLPKLPENYFEPVGKGGWPPIYTWIKRNPSEANKDLIPNVNSNLVQYLLKTDIHKRTKKIQWQIQTLHRDFSPGTPKPGKPTYSIFIHMCYIVYNTIYI